MNCGALLPRAPQRQRGANKLISSQTFPLAALQYFHVCGRPQLDAVIQRELSRTGLSDDVQYHQVPFMDIRLKSDKSNIKSKLYWKTSKKKSVMTEMRMISLFCSETRLILFRVAMFCWVTLSAAHFPRPPLLFPWRSAVTWDARNP